MYEHVSYAHRLHRHIIWKTASREIQFSHHPKEKQAVPSTPPWSPSTSQWVKCYGCGRYSHATYRRSLDAIVLTQLLRNKPVYFSQLFLENYIKVQNWDAQLFPEVPSGPDPVWGRNGPRARVGSEASGWRSDRPPTLTIHSGMKIMLLYFLTAPMMQLCLKKPQQHALCCQPVLHRM